MSVDSKPSTDQPASPPRTPAPAVPQDSATAGDDSASAQRTVKKVAIIGLPNTGKSQVFNNLTGNYTVVANYPLTTVSMKRATCRIDADTYEIIDTPGLHCLYIHSEEELIVRDMIFADRPDVIVQCIDANQLKQSLTLTVDLLELDIPMVVSLNAIDETAKKGVRIDSAELSRALGITVIESIAIKGVGTKELQQAIKAARPAAWPVDYGPVINDGVPAVEAQLPEQMPFKPKAALLLLLDDPFLAENLKENYGPQKLAQLENEVRRYRRQFRGHLGQDVNDKRNAWVNDIVARSTTQPKTTPGQFSRFFGRMCRHPVFGLPILAFFLLATFFLVVNVAGFLDGEILSPYVVDPVMGYVENLVPSGFWHDFLIGHYGILTLGLFNAIVTVLPILSVFFLMFAFLEDIGYIPNLCVLTKRMFEKVGLSGKAIMPLILALGCKTMATLVTKGLASRKEKIIAIYLIAFAIPCAAQLAIDMAVLGRLGGMRALGAFLIAYGTLVVVEIAAGFVLNKMLKGEEKSDFIQELPAIRMPSLKAILVKTYYRMYWFLKEAIPIFLIAAVVLFVFEQLGVLDFTKTLLLPIVKGWLGLPIDTVDALILSLARHEAAAGLLLNMIEAGQLNYIQAIVAVVITTMFVPCFANIVAMCKELGARTGLTIALAINVSSFILAGILNLILLMALGR